MTHTPGHNKLKTLFRTTAAPTITIYLTVTRDRAATKRKQWNIAKG